MFLLIPRVLPPLTVGPSGRELGWPWGRHRRWGPSASTAFLRPLPVVLVGSAVHFSWTRGGPSIPRARHGSWAELRTGASRREIGRGMGRGQALPGPIRGRPQLPAAAGLRRGRGPGFRGLDRRRQGPSTLRGGRGRLPAGRVRPRSPAADRPQAQAQTPEDPPSARRVHRAPPALRQRGGRGPGRHRQGGGHRPHPGPPPRPGRGPPAEGLRRAERGRGGQAPREAPRDRPGAPAPGPDPPGGRPGRVQCNARTASDDVEDAMDLKRRRISSRSPDRETTEGVLSGALGPQDAPTEWRPVAELLTVLRTLPATTPSGRAAAVGDDPVADRDR